MNERKRLWRAVHDLRAERPVILFETAWIDRYVADDEVLCEDPFLRCVEPPHLGLASDVLLLPPRGPIWNGVEYHGLPLSSWKVRV